MTLEYASYEELARCELLRNVAEEAIQILCGEPAVRTLALGEVLISPEDDNDHIYLLLSGKLSVHFCATDTPSIRDIGVGLSVGELSVLDGSPPTAYVVAREVSRVYALHRDQVFALLGNQCPLARNLLAIMARWIKSNTVHMLDDRSRIDVLTDHAYMDGLTGLFNRRWLENALPELMESSQSLCVMLIDVDHFKHYNDTQGHTAGDCALVELGRVLRASVRPIDSVVRFGGEEFLVLLPDGSLDDSRHVAERVRSRVETTLITQGDGSPLPGITISAGLAIYAPGQAPSELIDLADAELYRAKIAGRNRVCG